MTATVNRLVSIEVDDVVRMLITYIRNAVRPDVDLPPVCNHVFFDCPTPDKADL